MGKISSADVVTFINNKAQVASIRNSYNVYPVLKSINNSSAVYEYKGSGKKPYTIKISYENGLSVQCSCPYDYGGICKHSVASLENFALTLRTNESLSPKVQTQKKETYAKVNSDEIFSKILSFPLLNNCIDVEMVLADVSKVRSTSYSASSVQIISVKPKEIKTRIAEWHDDSLQTFTIDAAQEKFKMQCSCYDKTFDSYCKHLKPSFEKIVKIFGADYFQDDFFERKKENFLADYGLTLTDDYQKYFSFSIDHLGFHAVSNFPDIQKISHRYESRLAAEIKDNKKSKTVNSNFSEFGEGLIFEFNENQLEYFAVVQAKLNRDRTELSTHFKEIMMYRVETTIHTYSEKSATIILTTSKINTLLSHFYKKKSAENLQNLLHVFNKLLTILPDFPIYAHALTNSFARKNLQELIISSEKPQLVFDFSEDKLFYSLDPKLKLDNEFYPVSSENITITPIFIKLNNTIYPITDAVLAADLMYYYEKSEPKYIKSNALRFKDDILEPLSAKYEISTQNFIKTKSVKKSKDQEVLPAYHQQVFIEDHQDMVSFRLAMQYPNKLVNIESKEMLISINEKGKFSYLERDQGVEDNFRKLFTSWHPDFQKQEEEYFLHPLQLMENFWMLETIEKAKKQGVEFFGLRNLSSFKYNLNKPSVSLGVESGLDWFDVKIDVSFGDQKVALKDLQKAFIKKSNFITLSDGSIGILSEEWMKKFAHYFKAGEVKKDMLQISNFQFGIIDELYLELEDKPDFLVQLYEKKKRIQNISDIHAVEIPKGIKATLRDYQHEGLNWLNFLDENQLGGCLADDMGLGKTLQTIAFLQHLKVTKKPKLPSIIIAPTSLIFNWENEIKMFCPTLKLLIFTGANRLENIDFFTDYDVVITTYGSILNDIEILKDKTFNYIILDESQAIKNPNSKRYKSVRLLNGYNRIALSGTPIENNTFDLYAQFNFLNPGILGNMAHFKKEFSDAIDKEKEVATSELLAKIIHPFILRRTKEQVAKELPDKIESIIYCEMEKEQRKVYESFKNEYRDYLLNKIDENGVAKSQMFVLEGLMKLRQICNSPAIISDQEDYGNASIKLDLLMENIKEKTGNHKILVFSSFVKMLQLIKSKLEDEQISYEYLDGQTRDRQSRVENFQNESNVRVFLISTKAGGTGLNLTEADYVFIIDPWWNPAVENQAIDRSYRIGQKKQVMAYRMICKDTIEEKILALQHKKKSIASSIISIDEDTKSFNAQEIKDLFS